MVKKVYTDLKIRSVIENIGSPCQYAIYVPFNKGMKRHFLIVCNVSAMHHTGLVYVQFWNRVSRELKDIYMKTHKDVGLWLIFLTFHVCIKLFFIHILPLTCLNLKHRSWI